MNPEPDDVAQPAARSGGRALRLWLGIAVTVLAIGWAIRGVNVGGVVDSMRSARLAPVLLIMAAQWLGLWVRAVRWRYLTAALEDAPRDIGSHYRATAVGFLAINVLPFRIGELVRPWFLARETGVRGSAALGTLLLERAIDFACVVLISGVVLFFLSADSPEWFRSGATVFAVLSLAPFGLVIALQISEEATLSLLAAVLRPFPERLGKRALDLITQICLGLASLKGIRPLFMVALYSVLLWGVIFASVFVFGFIAFGIQLPLKDALLAVYTLHVFTALAAALPAAPGFFGVFHVACTEALSLFGISREVALAFGTIVHVGYWLPVTAAGAFEAIRSGTRLTDLTAVGVGKAPSEPHR